MKRIVNAGVFFVVSLTACLGVGAAYVELTERVCASGDWCADPRPLMVNPPIANGRIPHEVYFFGARGVYLSEGCCFYGPRE